MSTGMKGEAVNNHNKKAVLLQAEPCDAAVILISIEFYNKWIMEHLRALNMSTLSMQSHLAPKPA